MKKLIAYLGLMLFSGFLYPQEPGGVKSLDIKSPRFIKLSIGLNVSNFRDYATSPLVYSGSSLYTEISHLAQSDQRESEFGLSYTVGQNNSIVVTHVAVSKVQCFTGYYSRLYNLGRFSDSIWNFKAGGMLNITGNYRYNPSLQNNSIGVEIMGNLMAGIQAQRNVSRTKSKSKKVWFVKYRLSPRKKELGFRLNLGIVNSQYRNGYIYAGQSSVINDPKFYDGYAFHMFSGFRMSTALAYTIHLKNENALRVSYVWDAYKTGGDLDAFEMASHVLKFSLLFKTN